MASNYQVCSTVHKISHYICDKVMHQQHLSGVKNCHQLTGYALTRPTLFKTTIQTIMTWIKINVFWPHTHSVNADSDWPDWRALPTDSLHHHSLAGSYAKLIPTWSHLHNFTDNIFKLVPNENEERKCSSRQLLGNMNSVFSVLWWYPYQSYWDCYQQ